MGYGTTTSTVERASALANAAKAVGVIEVEVAALRRSVVTPNPSTRHTRTGIIEREVVEVEAVCTKRAAEGSGLATERAAESWSVAGGTDLRAAIFMQRLITAISGRRCGVRAGRLIQQLEDVPQGFGTASHMFPTTSSHRGLSGIRYDRL
jgi:hypothetical protein